MTTPPRSDARFPVVEIFGPTIQGEGKLAGAVQHFVRFGGCDFRCHWCDTPHAVLPEHVRDVPRLNYGEISAKVRDLPPAQWVSFTGGNPVLLDLEWLVQELKAERHPGEDHSIRRPTYKIAVETQGSMWRDWLRNVDLLTISPKPPSARMPQSAESLRRFLNQAIGSSDRAEHTVHWLKDHAILKVPVYNREDYEWAVGIHQAYDLPFYLSVVTESGGLYGDFKPDTQSESPSVTIKRYRQIADMVLSDPRMQDVRVFPQLHYLMWGDERGR